MPRSEPDGIVRRIGAAIRDWVFTVPFLIAFGLVLLVFDVAGRIARLFGLRPFERVMSALQKALVAMLWISGTRVEVERPDTIDPDRGYVLVSNHQGLFDIPLIGSLFPRTHPKYVAKKSLGKWLPSISLNLRKGGNVLIDRSDGIGAVRAIARMARTAQERNRSVVIFPEEPVAGTAYSASSSDPGPRRCCGRPTPCPSSPWRSTVRGVYSSTTCSRCRMARGITSA